MTNSTSEPDSKSIQTKPLIQANTLIADMVVNYPQVVGYLVDEYGFHCVSCFISGFEVLEDGARVHGIEGEDFEDMLAAINKIAAGEIEDTWER